MREPVNGNSLSPRKSKKLTLVFAQVGSDVTLDDIGAAGDGHLKTERVVRGTAVHAVEIDALVAGERNASAQERGDALADLVGATDRRGAGVGTAALIFKTSGASGVQVC